ncbi:MAG: putative integral rane protein [Frankiales bacterium]|nr:putative integral rane protein [Frankiales bacterium]
MNQSANLVPPRPAPASGNSAGRVARFARSFAAAILAVLGVVCITASPEAIWGRNLVLNTDRYVQTLKPLAEDPAIQDAVIAAVDRQVDTHVDVTELTAGLLPPRAASLIGPPLQSAMANLVNSVVTKFVQSDAFVTLWVQVNRVAHTQLTQLLTGSRSKAVKVADSGVVTLDLQPVVSDIKAQLVAAGVTAAENIPVVGVTIEVAKVKGLADAQKAVRALNTLADWLPWTGLGLIILAVLVARKRRTTLIASMLGVAAGMVVVAVGVLVSRSYYLDDIPSDALPRPAAERIFDILVRFLRDGLRIVAAVALLIAFIAWLLGPSKPATAARRWARVVPAAATQRVASGPVGALVAHHAMTLRIGAVALGLLVVLFWDDPSVAVLITIAVLVVLVLALVELLRRAARDRSALA